MCAGNTYGETVDSFMHKGLHILYSDMLVKFRYLYLAIFIAFFIIPFYIVLKFFLQNNNGVAVLKSTNSERVLQSFSKQGEASALRGPKPTSCDCYFAKMTVFTNGTLGDVILKVPNQWSPLGAKRSRIDDHILRSKPESFVQISRAN